MGYNVNIGFSGGLDPPMGDADYLAVFRSIVLPIARKFNPHFVLVSCGFSAAGGHPSTLGGYNVTPNCFGYLTRSLSELAEGKIVLALEGGFELEPLCNCAEACVQTLLGKEEYSSLSRDTLERRPSDNAVRAINGVIAIQEKHWKGLDVSSGEVSHIDYMRMTRENETCVAMASLSVENKRSESKAESTVESDSRTQPVDLSNNRCLPTVGNSDDALYIDETPVGGSLSADSSPLDVVGLSTPSSPAAKQPETMEMTTNEQEPMSDV
uniref:histone deacetylase n=1 Tax=Ciona savignyi TaxID=51511 RepID=H2Z8D8_CIOSA